MSVDVETVELKPHIAAIIAEVGLDNLSAKTVRESVESKLGSRRARSSRARRTSPTSSTR